MLDKLYFSLSKGLLLQKVGDDVTYAELCLNRPTSLADAGTAYRGGSQWRGEDPTIYAEIDHSRRPPPLNHPLVSPATHREIVTVRTPLMGSQQESCV